MAPELRRGAIYVIVASPLLGAVYLWAEHFIMQRDVIDEACRCSPFVMLALAMVVPLRWALRVDNRGIARRLVFRWDLWTWSDLASGRIHKRRASLVDPDRPWWRRSLRFGFMSSEDTNEVLGLINARYQLPPPPELPDKLEIMYSLRRLASFDWKGIHLLVRGQPHEYLWNEIRRVHIIRIDHLRRDFDSLEIVLPDREISLRMESTQYGTFPTWRGATGEEISEFLLQHVPAEQVDEDILGERPTRRIDIEKKLNEARKRKRYFRLWLWIFSLLFAVTLIWMALANGIVAALAVTAFAAIPLVPIGWFIHRRIQKECTEFERLLASSDDNDINVPPADSPETNFEEPG